MIIGLSEEIITKPNTDTITSSKYTIKDGYVSKIVSGTDVQELKRNLQASNSFTIKNKNGVTVTSGKIGTGMK